MKRFILIIDGHNFFFRTLYGIQHPKTAKVLQSNTSRKLYGEKLMSDFTFSMKKLQTCVNGVLFVEDSRSWRKGIDGDAIGYKSNRTEKQEQIDWTGFEECTSHFRERLSTHGVTFCRQEGAEADDLIFYWCAKLTGSGKSAIIHSTDKDMLQLVRNYGDGGDVMLYDAVGRAMYVPSGYRDMIENAPKKTEGSIFTLSSGVNGSYDGILSYVKSNGIKITEVDADRSLVTKVLCGDRSDNIPSVYSYVKNGRTFNLTEAKSAAVLERFTERNGSPFIQDMLYSASSVRSLAECVVEVVRKEVDIETVVRNIERNTKYISLDRRSIPPEVFGDIAKKVNESAIGKLDVHGIMNEGTREMTPSIFKPVKGDVDLSFITDRPKSLFE